MPRNFNRGNRGSFRGNSGGRGRGGEKNYNNSGILFGNGFRKKATDPVLSGYFTDDSGVKWRTGAWINLGGKFRNDRSAQKEQQAIADEINDILVEAFEQYGITVGLKCTPEEDEDNGGGRRGRSSRGRRNRDDEEEERPSRGRNRRSREEEEEEEDEQEEEDEETDFDDDDEEVEDDTDSEEEEEETSRPARSRKPAAKKAAKKAPAKKAATKKARSK